MKIRNLTYLLLAIGIFSLSAFTTQILTSYKISDDYIIKFDGRGAEGTFRGLKGDIIFDENNLENARIQVSVDAKSISTGNKTQDKHARGSSWFDVENYPTIVFTSEQFSKTTEGYTVTGFFEMHGFKKQETIPFTFEDNVFSGKLTINRKEYGIEGPFFAFTVSDEFEVAIKVPVE